MSAWVVDKKHIDLLITAGLMFPQMRMRNTYQEWTRDNHHVRLTDENADAIGGQLWAENYTSVKSLYGVTDDSEDVPGPADFEATQVLTYTFTRVPGTLDPVVVLKALDCYEYQSCEHDGWKTSGAHEFCEVLRSVAISILPGYDDAPWDFDDQNYFTNRGEGASS